MVKLVGWKNELVRVEELAYQGKEGYGEIKQLMKPSALPDMERHTHVPADWIKAPIHLREEAGQDVSMNIVQLLERILDTYQNIDGPLTDHFVRIVEGLRASWTPLARLA
uniref:Uncharacterized protein n=1 Tax=Mycena chlorophos TaxID=658473 RepID=A0ABQ0LRW2_MYCCL|nr:predicted protein [Mycena chlorophos]